jgi:hypothetical protein
MKNDIKLHKEHGLNPTIPICVFCGEDKNEIALLGADYKGEAPMHMAIDNEPCEECQEKLDGGIWKHFIGDCGHNGFIKIEVLKEILNEDAFDELKDTPIFRMEKCFKCMGMT